MTVVDRKSGRAHRAMEAARHTKGVPGAERKFAVLPNRQSGRGKGGDERAGFLRRVEQAPDVSLLQPGEREDITETVRRASSGHDVVVAAGAGGTFSAACNALFASGLTLGVMPLATFNFFARSIGLQRDLEAAWDTIRSGLPDDLAVGEVNGSRFITNASIGAYAAVLETRETVYRRWGRSWLMASWSVVKDLSTPGRPLKMTLTVDGETHRARSSMAFVVIRPYQLKEFGLEGKDEIGDGHLALYLTPGESRPMLILRALKVLFGAVAWGEGYSVLHGREIVVETEPEPQLVARDGERERITGPFLFRRHGSGLQGLVPAKQPGQE